MYQPDLIDLPIEVFGGYCPAIPPSDLAPGAASIAQDVIFPMGALRTRGGLKQTVTAPSPLLNGGTTVNGLKSYLTSTLAKRLLAFDLGGGLYTENPQGVFALVGSVFPLSGSFSQSVTLFSREYQGFFNAGGSINPPKQFDDTNWDRVSQKGPGIAPVAIDIAPTVPVTAASEPALVTITASPNGIATSDLVTIDPRRTGNEPVSFFRSITFTTAAPHGLAAGQTVVVAGTTSVNYGAGYYNKTFLVSSVISATQFKVRMFSSDADTGGNGTTGSVVCTITTGIAHGLQPGQNVTTAGIGVAGYNGTFVITSVPSTTTFTFNNTVAGLAASAGGTASVPGHISAGLHNVSVAFITRQGFITAPAPWSSWTAAGNLAALISDIPTGPVNIVARLLLFTPVITPPATQGVLYSLPTGSTQIANSVMLINDNVTTSVTLDFNDTILIAGFNANYLLTQLELGEVSSFNQYNSRLVGLGERNCIQNLLNLDWTGGVGSDPALPLGWTKVNAGGSVSYSGGNIPQAHYIITGDGASAVVGKITQPAYADFLGVPIIQRNTSYQVRVRVIPFGVTQGTLHVNLQSTAQAFTTVGFSFLGVGTSGTEQEFTFSLTDAALAVPPSDLLLQVYVDGTLNLGATYAITFIEIFPTNAPYNYSTARISHSFNPESFDSITGQVQVRPGDGQQLQSSFPLRNNFYLAKDHFLCYVNDDGVNEPSSWAVNEVSATIGICGPNAVDWTEEWAAFAERSGVYICWGSDPVKISQEISTDASGTGKIAWDSINWTAAYTIWVRIDQTNKRILIGAPVNGATTPNIVFVLDYQWLSNAEEIAISPLITYSTFTGKMLAHGKGRRWALWTISANSMCFAERSDGTAQPFFGAGTGVRGIFQQIDCATQPTDNGSAISWNYQGYGSPSHIEEQEFQLGAHRKLLGYMKFRAVGVGLLGLAISTAQRATLLRSYNLSLSPTGDGERPLNLHGERFFVTLRTNSVIGSWFQMEKLILCMRKDPAFVVRGLSA